ncbi:MAG: 30S ribosomal protein S20 [bacterium]|nr:30S ribosomal protein S20 [bacterium]
MAITSSAKKAIGVAKRRGVFNARRKKDLKDTLKEVSKLIESGSKKEAESMLSRVYKVIDKAAKRGVLKANTASRTKSRITKRISNLGKTKAE